MGKHSKDEMAEAQAKADAFDAQWADSQATYVPPTLQEKINEYNDLRKANAEARNQ